VSELAGYAMIVTGNEEFDRVVMEKELGGQRQGEGYNGHTVTCPADRNVRGMFGCKP
jgi:hypothetical protein